MTNITEWSFASDANKMHDFMTMSMEEFMKSYSYLEEKDYYATYLELWTMLQEKYPEFQLEEV